MKQYLYFLMALVLILMFLVVMIGGALMWFNAPHKSIVLVGKVQDAASEIIEKKYPIIACGGGVAMPDYIIGEVSLCFNTKKLFNRDQLREMLIVSSEELLKQINENKEIQQFLGNTPFSIENVQIIIYNYDADRRGWPAPEIRSAEISDGVLDYMTIDPEDSFKTKDWFEETYEEALEIIKTKRE